MLNLFNKKIVKHDSPSNRKQRSENRLADLGIQYNPNLPHFADIEYPSIRSSEEVAARIIALWEVVNIASNAKDSDRPESVEFLKEVDLWDSLSPKEQQFLIKNSHDKQRNIDLAWQTEVLKVLYWSLKEIDELGKPVEDNNLVAVSDRVLENFPSLDSFLRNSQLRPASDILDEADFIYRLHWCSRNHRRKEQGVPRGYNYSVIRERHFAFNWLTDPNSLWDEISCDT